MISTPASYMGGHGFESRPARYITVFCIFLAPPGRSSDGTQKKVTQVPVYIFLYSSFTIKLPLDATKPTQFRKCR